MKKFYYLIATAIMALTFTSCEDVPEPFGQPVNPNKDIPTVDPKGTGTQADPFNVAAAVAKCKETGTSATSQSYYIKGIASEEYTVDNFQNVTVKIVDVENSTEEFTVYRCKGADGKGIPEGTKINVGDEIVVYGPVMNYKDNTAETATGAYIVSINGEPTAEGGGGGGGDTPTPTPTPSGTNLLTNGDFEVWTGNTPDNWNGVAGNATLEKSTAGRSGNALLVKGASQNKRLAYKEIKLKAGKYTITAYAKAATATAASVRPGYAKLTDGVVKDTQNDYKYGEYVNDITNADWKVVSHTFTLDAETSLNIIFMNPKSTASDVLLDDVSLTTENGGIVDGGDTGGDTPTPSGSAYLDENFANGQGSFTIEDKVFSGVWTAASYQNDKYMKATAFINKANNDAENWLISPEFNIASATKPTLTFLQVINTYFGTVANEAMVFAKKEGGEWTKLTISYPTPPSGKYSKFTDDGAAQSVDLTAFKSSKTQIAFVYKGTSTACGTWEVKDVKVAEP